VITGIAGYILKPPKKRKYSKKNKKATTYWKPKGY